MVALSRYGEVMSCPECSNVRHEYLVFRKAVERFAGILDQLEGERRRIADEQRPADIPPIHTPKGQEIWSDETAIDLIDEGHAGRTGLRHESVKVR